MKQGNDRPTDRRKFLKTTAAASAGAVAATLLPGTAAADVDGGQPQGAEKPKGYHLTQHILDYYKTAKQ